jgi:hypothetical protein
VKQSEHAEAVSDHLRARREVAAAMFNVPGLGNSAKSSLQPSAERCHLERSRGGQLLPGMLLPPLAGRPPADALTCLQPCPPRCMVELVVAAYRPPCWRMRQAVLDAALTVSSGSYVGMSTDLTIEDCSCEQCWRKPLQYGSDLVWCVGSRDRPAYICCCITHTRSQTARHTRCAMAVMQVQSCDVLPKPLAKDHRFCVRCLGSNMNMWMVHTMQEPRGSLGQWICRPTVSSTPFQLFKQACCARSDFLTAHAEARP